MSNINVLQPQLLSHHASAGINPIVDAAGYLFSLLGQLSSQTQDQQIEDTLINELNTFQNTIRRNGYPEEYITVCCFILRTTIDELLRNQAKADQEIEDQNYEDKFFTILDRMIRETTHYIDLMELMYICLSLGYKGQYRNTTNGLIQLEQITHHLYKHIQAHRGPINKTLSPIKSTLQRKKKLRIRHFSLSFILIMTACIVMLLFISMGYLMDVVSNEATKTIAALGNATT